MCKFDGADVECSCDYVKKPSRVKSLLPNDISLNFRLFSDVCISENDGIKVSALTIVLFIVGAVSRSV